MATVHRLRTYLTPDEVAQLLRAAKKSRHGARNHAMILLTYRHGLRASELVGLRPERVEEAHGPGRRPQRALDDGRGHEDPSPGVLAGAVREQELRRGVVVHLDPKGGQEVLGLVEDAADEGVVEESKRRSHGL